MTPPAFSPSTPATPSSVHSSPGSRTSRDLLYRLPHLLSGLREPAQLQEWDHLFTGEIVAHLTALDILRGHRSLDLGDAIKRHLFFEHGVLFRELTRPGTARLLLQLEYQDFSRTPAADEDNDYVVTLLALARRYVTVLPDLQPFIDQITVLFESIPSESESSPSREQSLRSVAQEAEDLFDSIVYKE